MEAAVESQGGNHRFRPFWLCHASPCPTRGQVLHQAQLRQKASIGDTEGREEKDRSAFLCGFRSLERSQLTMLASFLFFLVVPILPLDGELAFCPRNSQLRYEEGSGYDRDGGGWEAASGRGGAASSSASSRGGPGEKS